MLKLSAIRILQQHQSIDLTALADMRANSLPGAQTPWCGCRAIRIPQGKAQYLEIA
jgi:hypothetical protein